MPFTKGDPNINRNGRPVGSVSLVTLLKKKLETLSPDGKRIAAEVLTDNVIQDALDGNKQARDLVFKYIEGLPQAKVDVTSGGKPVAIYGGNSIQGYDSDEEDIQAEEED